MKQCSLVFFAFWFLSFNVIGQVRSDVNPTNQGPCCLVQDANKIDDNLLTEGQLNFKPKINLGVGLGFSNMYGEMAKSDFAPALRVGLGSRVTPSLVVGLEFYGGQLSSEQPANKWTTGMHETSVFEAIDANAKIDMASIIDKTSTQLLVFLCHIYIGTGIGVVNSTVTNFKGSFNEYTHLNINKYKRSGDIAAYIPLNLGIRLPMTDFFGSKNTAFMLNYQISYTFSDYLDGYQPPKIAVQHRSNNVYTVITVGFSFLLHQDF